MLIVLMIKKCLFLGLGLLNIFSWCIKGFLDWKGGNFDKKRVYCSFFKFLMWLRYIWMIKFCMLMYYIFINLLVLKCDMYIIWYNYL